MTNAGQFSDLRYEGLCYHAKSFTIQKKLKAGKPMLLLQLHYDITQPSPKGV